MTMSHKEALEAAVQAVWDELGGVVPVEDAEVVLRRYCEARGLVMVPKVATEEMWMAGINAPLVSIYQDMLAAAPDPFRGE